MITCVCKVLAFQTTEFTHKTIIVLFFNSILDTIRINDFDTNLKRIGISTLHFNYDL